MNRRAFAVAVVVVWVAAIGWLARRELWRPRAAALAEATLSLPPGAAYYAVSLAGRQVGYASTTLDTLGDTLRVVDVLVLEALASSRSQRTQARTDVTLSRSLRLREFIATVRGDGARFDTRGRVEGDSLLELEVLGAADTGRRRIRLREPLLLPSLLWLNLAFGGRLQPGATLTRRVFDPVLLKTRSVSMTVVTESTLVLADSAVFDSTSARFVPVDTDTLRAWHLEGTDGGVPIGLWVDEDGLPVRTISASGFGLERTAFEVAYENFRRAGGARAAPARGLERTTVAAAGVALPAAERARLRVLLEGQPLDGLELDGGRQRLAGDTLIVTREGSAALDAGYRLPIARRELIPFIRPEPLIESDDPRVQAQARQIVGRARPRAAAERLVAWVAENVRRQVADDVPSAVTVLRSRRGDSNEHVVLFVALARAVGLPARTVAGLVLLDGRFYYHAWAEVYLNDWVAVDPTFGQFPADAARIRVVEGGLARHLELGRRIGDLTVRVLPDAE